MRRVLPESPRPSGHDSSDRKFYRRIIDQLTIHATEAVTPAPVGFHQQSPDPSVAAFRGQTGAIEGPLQILTRNIGRENSCRESLPPAGGRIMLGLAEL